MQKRSLGQTLTRQWMWFSIVLSLLFSGMSLLALYMLEDHFLDQKLRGVALSVGTGPTEPPLPAGFVAYPDHALPDDVREKFAGRSEGAHSEFRRANGRYAHALRARGVTRESFVLVYDVTDEMTVNRALADYWIYALVLIALFALIARLLARWFMTRWSRSATRLIEQLRDGESPDALQRHAAQEPVQEFAELAQRNAEALQNKLDALAREQEILAFLNHELRTPLQSARTNLEVLAATMPATDAWSRLTRAIQRLERVSHSIRWLSSATVASESSAEHYHTAVAPLLDAVLSELQPLGARKGATLQVQRGAAPIWNVPADVAETLLANLLLNALQHGDATDIVVTLQADGVIISNGVVAGSDNAGTGLGLLIVQRWAQRFGLQVSLDRAEVSRCVVRVTSPLASAA